MGAQATALRLMDFGVFAAFDVEVNAGGETHVQEVLGLVPTDELSFDPGAAAADIVQVRLQLLTRPRSRQCAAVSRRSGSPTHVCAQSPHIQESFRVPLREADPSRRSRSSLGA